MGTTDGIDGSLKMVEVRSLEVASPSLFSVGLSGHVYTAGSPHGQGHLKVRNIAVKIFDNFHVGHDLLVC